MQYPTTSSAAQPSVQTEKQCSVCGRPASCRHYGAISCDACKMFFRRTVVEKLKYTCRMGANNCLALLRCRYCRFQQCLRNGMEFSPRNPRILELKNEMDDKLTAMLGNLSVMDTRRHLRFVSFYSEEDPSLDDILGGVRLKSMKKDSAISPNQWSFLATYSLVNFFSNFDFIKQLSFEDKKIVFHHSTLRSSLLCCGMRTLREGKNKMTTPDGQDVYPKALVENFKFDPEILNRTCCLVVSKLIELKITNEEFVLLNLIFFCNPGLPSLSDSAKDTLATNQKAYASALFQYCLLTHQQSGPSRFNDLLSICHVISKNLTDMQYIVMMFQCHLPGFKFRKLVVDTYHLANVK